MPRKTTNLKPDKYLSKETEKELEQMSRAQVTAPLTYKEIIFCEEYVRHYNCRLAAKKAGYSNKASHVLGYKVRQKPAVSRYLAWLKIQVSKDFKLGPIEIIDLYARIAFSDVSDYVQARNGKLYLVDTEKVDGQIIKSIKQGRDGITVELEDRLKALEKLEKYFSVMPIDWKQKIEERKVQLMAEKLELERVKAGQTSDEVEDDGFIQALTGAAEEVWSE